MRPPAFQFYADDFLAGTIDMSAEEVGAYIRLLCHQWTRGEIPVSDQAKLSRVAGGLVSSEVLAKFPSGKNERLESERKKQAEYRELQSAKGKASAQARLSRGSTPAQPSTEPDGQPKGNSPSPSPSPSPTSNLQSSNTYVAEELAMPFASPEFKDAWSLFQKHRSEIRKPLKATSAKMSLKMLAEMGEQRAIRCIEHTVTKGWQGLQEPDANNRNSQPRRVLEHGNAF